MKFRIIVHNPTPRAKKMGYTFWGQATKDEEYEGYAPAKRALVFKSAKQAGKKLDEVLKKHPDQIMAIEPLLK